MLVNTTRVIHLFDKWDSMGGITVAYEPVLFDPSNGYPRGDFARVAVSYCSRKDRYDRKLGQQNAVFKLRAGEFMLLPIYRTGRPTKTLINFFNQF